MGVMLKTPQCCSVTYTYDCWVFMTARISSTLLSQPVIATKRIAAIGIGAQIRSTRLAQFLTSLEMAISTRVHPKILVTSNVNVGPLPDW